MKTRTGIFAALACAMAMAATAYAEEYKMFWLTETITRDTIGPIVRKTGNTFRVAGREWTILDSKTGEILFYDAAARKKYGPYDFMLNRIVDLGGVALGISRIDTFDSGENDELPHILTSVDNSTTVTAPPVDRPRRWTPTPIPSTNPRAHKSFFDNFYIIPRKRPASAMFWAEPIRSVNYNWEIGDYAGTAGEKIEMSSYGIAGSYGNWFAELYAISSAKTAGGIVPDGTSLSDLNMDSGSGYGGRAGYLYSFVIDGNWNANFGGFASYESTTFNIEGTALTSHGVTTLPPPTPEDGVVLPTDATNVGSVVKEYTFDSFTSEVDMSELTVAIMGGIDYTSDYWGVGAYGFIDLYSDIEIDGKLSFNDKSYDIAADRAHPIGITFSGWYSPFMEFFFGGSATFGNEISARMFAGWFF